MWGATHHASGHLSVRYTIHSPLGCCSSHKICCAGVQAYCGEPETAAEETSSGPAEGESTTTTGGWTLDIPRPWSLVSDVIGQSVYNCLKIWHPLSCLVAIVSADCDSYFVGLP